MNGCRDRILAITESVILQCIELHTWEKASFPIRDQPKFHLIITGGIDQFSIRQALQFRAHTLREIALLLKRHRCLTLNTKVERHLFLMVLLT